MSSAKVIDCDLLDDKSSSSSSKDNSPVEVLLSETVPAASQNRLDSCSGKFRMSVTVNSNTSSGSTASDAICLLDNVIGDGADAEVDAEADAEADTEADANVHMDTSQSAAASLQASRNKATASDRKRSRRRSGRASSPLTVSSGSSEDEELCSNAFLPLSQRSITFHTSTASPDGRLKASAAGATVTMARRKYSTVSGATFFVADEEDEDAVMEIISISDDSDDEVPFEAFAFTHLAPAPALPPAPDNVKSEPEALAFTVKQETNRNCKCKCKSAYPSQEERVEEPPNEQLLAQRRNTPLSTFNTVTLPLSETQKPAIHCQASHHQEQQPRNAAPLSLEPDLADDATSAPDDSDAMDLDKVHEEETDTQYDGTSTSLDLTLQQRHQELLKPRPAQRRLHSEQAFRNLVQPQGSSPGNEWVQSRIDSKGHGVNLPKEWEEMANRLLQWQKQHGDEDHDQPITCDNKGNSNNEDNAQPTRLKSKDPIIDQSSDVRVDTLRDDPSMTAMAFVPSIKKNYVNPRTALPVREFAVITSCDELLYSFRLEVRTSLIPNAGNGVFLKFLGAMRRRPSKAQRRQQVEQDRPLAVMQLHKQLRATHPDGFGITLNLTGEHLKSRYNSYYPLRKLNAVLPGTKRRIKITFSNPDLPLEEDELEGLKYPTARIGHYGLFTLDDYVEAPKRTFSSFHPSCGYIDIGRYGPFRKQDRKPDLDFDCKNFIFGFEPGMWGFGVAETLHGRKQVIDITDDLTGETHQTARENIPMHVNEVGNNPNLKETIRAYDEGDSLVKYFLLIREPMRKGDEIEVLVNYRDIYEDNRVRKGYGLACLTGDDRGDDHLPSCLRRNIIDRSEVVFFIHEARPVYLYGLINFLLSTVKKLSTRLDNYLDELKSMSGSAPALCTLSTRQIVAVRRLEWITAVIQRDVQKKLDGTLRDDYIPDGDLDALLFTVCQKRCKRLFWNRWKELFDLLQKYPGMKNQAGDDILEALETEAVEEVFFQDKEKLRLPLDESRWCPLAAQMTRELCFTIAKATWNQHGTDYNFLATEFFKVASSAAAEIRQNPNLKRLAFGKRFEDPFVPHDGLISTSGEVYVAVAAPPTLGAKYPDLVGRRTAEKNVGDINTTWYICRQVLFLIESLSVSTGLSQEQPNFYTKMCLVLGIGAEMGTEALSKEVLPLRCKVKPKKQRKKDSTSANRKATTKSKQNEGGASKERAHSSLFWLIVWTGLQSQGWNLEHGNRPNDFYACPPGVSRGKGFKPRVDFFDSIPLVLHFVKTDPTWSQNEVVKTSLKEYHASLNLWEKIKGKKGVPKFPDRKEQAKWLLEQTRQQQSNK